MKLLLLILVSAISAGAQVREKDQVACGERGSFTAQSSPTNSIRQIQTDSGLRGPCARPEWIAKMRELGVKQASFAVERRTAGGESTVNILFRIYLWALYADHNTTITDPEQIRRINESGLASEIESFIVKGLERSQPAHQKPRDRVVETYVFSVVDRWIDCYCSPLLPYASSTPPNPESANRSLPR